jgi:hypothetical protein
MPTDMQGWVVVLGQRQVQMAYVYKQVKSLGYCYRLGTDGRHLISRPPAIAAIGIARGDQVGALLCYW